MTYLHELIPSSWSDATLPVGLALQDITADSRQVEPESLFVAMSGLTVDGRDYIESAVNAGAIPHLLGMNGMDQLKFLN